MRATVACFALTLTLAGCGRAEDRTSPAPTAPAAEAPSAAAPPSPAASTAEADFVGVWATAAELCQRNETWRFTPERVAAAGGASCAIEGAARMATGWSLQANCTAEGAPAPAALTLAISEVGPAPGMRLGGGPFTPPVDLVRCTPSLSAAG